ncbi:Tex family protein [Catellicoccus marimammalium]|uniref:Transcription accessory protein n=1 Tax=Catellicoccus marimammalium M35/04/3 TaxID=1234409 RepID=K8ZB53_9ENTE|nr:Tex family protein [Catellicoccus marimammalium]EKU27277.1 Transcription accessory protein [Catellicoccus marimammalium M35/04/3]
MEELILQRVQARLSYKPWQVEAVQQLLEEDNTIPFIARYRKERTGSLDEVAIKEIADTYQEEEQLEKRKQTIQQQLEKQKQWTKELAQQLKEAKTLQEVEDIYRPYKQKRKTKAMIAKEHGLEPFALWLLAHPQEEIETQWEKYLSDEVSTKEEVEQGAIEIIAERVSQQRKERDWVRKEIWQHGSIASTKKKEAEDEKAVFQMYYEYQEPIKSVPSHRVLAMNRGKKEKVLQIQFLYDKEKIENFFVKKAKATEDTTVSALIRQGIHEGLTRFLYPSLEREIQQELTQKAEKQAIDIFGLNLYHLLLQAPLQGKVILGLDPAYRTGCKLAVIDSTGKVLEIAVIYPTASPKQDIPKAKEKIRQLVEKYQVEMIAIGNGTASRESEQFISECIQEFHLPIYYTIVNEAGASVYSASEAARKEFPELAVEERSAISIARRLQDPLAELVKIEPKAVGVGQYQHDVSQKELEQALRFVVETAVNKVGVDVNTASTALLEYVSGLTATTAKNIVAYREEHGPFTERKELKNVSRLGPKSYEQAIGFLRIFDGKNPLDQTEIHPDSYSAAQELLQEENISLQELGTKEVSEQLAHLSAKEIAQTYNLGLETTKDILTALQKPGRDIREASEKPILRQDVLSMSDLQKGMKLQGTIRNVVDFGAFVDIGVKQDGLVHLSKMSKKFIHHPSEVVAVGDIVTVWVDDVDQQKQRIALSLLPIENEK